MGRWKPDAKGRLEQAALALYREQGYEQTTVTEIAERAELTERTFFRYFADKREVLFGWQEDLLQHVVAAIETAPATATPITMIMVALEAVGPLLQERQTAVLQRQAVIATHPELQERELLKLASLTAAMADALRRLAVPDSTASLAAQTGALVFQTAYAGWMAEPNALDLARRIQASYDDLKRIICG